MIGMPCPLFRTTHHHSTGICLHGKSWTWRRGSRRRIGWVLEVTLHHMAAPHPWSQRLRWPLLFPFLSVTLFLFIPPSCTLLFSPCSLHPFWSMLCIIPLRLFLVLFVVVFPSISTPPQPPTSPHLPYTLCVCLTLCPFCMVFVSLIPSSFSYFVLLLQCWAIFLCFCHPPLYTVCITPLAISLYAVSGPHSITFILHSLFIGCSTRKLPLQHPNPTHPQAPAVPRQGPLVSNMVIIQTLFHPLLCCIVSCCRLNFMRSTVLLQCQSFNSTWSEKKARGKS